MMKFKGKSMHNVKNNVLAGIQRIAHGHCEIRCVIGRVIGRPHRILLETSMEDWEEAPTINASNYILKTVVKNEIERIINA